MKLNPKEEDAIHWGEEAQLLSFLEQWKKEESDTKTNKLAKTSGTFQ